MTFAAIKNGAVGVKKYIVKRIVIACCCLLFLPAIFAWKTNDTANGDWEVFCQAQFLKDARELKQTTQQLKTAIDALQQNNTQGVLQAREALRSSRMAYKKMEYFMEYFFQFPVNMYNKAPVYEIEEPYMEYQSPIGFQVVEDLLYDDDVYANKQTLQQQAKALSSTAADIPATMYQFKCSEELLFISMNEELIRIMSLGITGYDAPLMKTGIVESGMALKSLSFVLSENIKYHAGDKNGTEALTHLESASLEMLNCKDFDSFDRLTILTNEMLPAQEHLLLYMRHLYPEIGNASVFNYKATNLYSPDALRKEMFDKAALTDTSGAMIRLGKQLFFEKRLSGNNTKSCGSCHKPEKYFTDALPKSQNFTNDGNVKRNAPSLLYSAFQHGQFLDARDSSFEKQVYAVLQNPDEMHTSLEDFPGKLNDKAYRKLFADAFNAKKKNAITTQHIAQALAAFERTLTPFNSAFDRYIAGDKAAMNATQIRGYNLFMGKAQCGSCHFAPIFNGSLPPLYNRTEMEVLGTPQNGNINKPITDNDSGRYNIFKIEFYKYAFKTPTVRNSSETAPYMHNGSFKTLEDVISFYNEGGGNGIGLNIETQTLSDRKIHLSKQEVADVKSFLESLKDKL